MYVVLIISVIIIIVIANIDTKNDKQNTAKKTLDGTQVSSNKIEANRIASLPSSEINKNNKLRYTNDSNNKNIKSYDFKPLSDLKFNVFGSTNEYKWFAVFNYFPKNRFEAIDLNIDDLAARLHVYSFKNGDNPKQYATIIASALLNRFGKDYFISKTILIVPASTAERTMNRFKVFCDYLSEFTGARNGYTMIENIRNRETAVETGNRDINYNEFLNFSGNFQSKDFLVIDDVRTSGRSSNAIYTILRQKGALNIVFVYLAKTVSSRSIPNERNRNNGATIDIMSESINFDCPSDDLPF